MTITRCVEVVVVIFDMFEVVVALVVELVVVVEFTCDTMTKRIKKKRK